MMGNGAGGVDRLAQCWPVTHGKLLEVGWLGYEGGYYVAGLENMERLWADRHGHRPVPRQALDAAAAAEIGFHVSRGRTFRRPCAAMWKCWAMLVDERPERVLGQVCEVAVAANVHVYPGRGR
jgi:hypothetical protein